MTIMGFSTGLHIMGPIIRTVCQELPHGYARECVLVSILSALEAGGETDHGWCEDPPFQRVWILSNGYMAGQAAYLPRRPPWWVRDRGAADTKRWVAEYALGAQDRDLHYDQDESAPEYLPVPGIEDSLDETTETAV